MQEKEYILTKLSNIIGMPVFEYSNGILQSLGKGEESHPFVSSPSLCNTLVNKAMEQELPVLYEDSHHVLFLCVHEKDDFILLGPVVLSPLDSIELHYYYEDYKIKNTKEKIMVLPINKIVALLQLITYEFYHYEFKEQEFLQVNQMTYIADAIDSHELPRFQAAEDIEEKYHHTYREEQKLLNYVREGCVEDALKYNMDIDTGTGRLSKKEVNHWKKVVIVAVTLCTRAAIEGGVSPSIAYQLSDFYIQKSDSYHTISELLACRNQAVRELTKQVKRKKESQKSSNYIEQCKDYISKRYKEKIYLEEVASALGLSSTYLSRLFSKECGMQFQEYINWFRVERAANLLVYSEESMAHIAEYVNFPTQSYFGKMFKKYKNMTPGEYRNQKKPTEFSTEQT